MGATASQAVLTLQINTINQTFSLTGSDTGEVLSVGSSGTISWDTSGLGGTGNGQAEDESRTFFSVLPGDPAPIMPPFGNFDTVLASREDLGGTVTFSLFTTTTTGVVTITGNDVPISYASMPADAIARLEGLLSQSLPVNLDQGSSGFSPIEIVEVVPEPSTAFLALCGVPALVRRRR